MKRMSIQDIVFDTVNVILLIIISIFALYPFIYTISISLSSATEATREGLHLLPGGLTFSAYWAVLGNTDTFIGYQNTIIRTIFGTILSLLFTCLASWPLSKPYMPHRRFYSFFIIFTMLFSGGIIPNYLLIKSMGLIDNRLALILPTMVTAFNVIVVKNFFASIPESLSESAKIDGANEFYILFKIIIPLSKPVLATVGLWVAVFNWNAWFDAMLYINSNSKQVLQIFLQRIVINDLTSLVEKGMTNDTLSQLANQTIKSATIIVTILPILCVYPFLQKYFVKGIMLGAVKG